MFHIHSHHNRKVLQRQIISGVDAAPEPRRAGSDGNLYIVLCRRRRRRHERQREGLGAEGGQTP